LEGSVQRAGNKVRVIAQLIDARSDAHLWAQTYDRDLADVFAIQSEIAAAIADQLRAKITTREKAAIEQRPTSDLAAFDQYTRAKNLILTGLTTAQEKSFRGAAELLDDAVARDPSFYSAFCQLVFVNDSLYAGGYDHTPARLQVAETALKKVEELRPDAPETHLARAQHLYYSLRDYSGALAALELASRGLSNDPRIFDQGLHPAARGQAGGRSPRAGRSDRPRSAQCFYPGSDRIELSIASTL
jgi:tetratricopeptide (TPR) repeat protein